MLENYFLNKRKIQIGRVGSVENDVLLEGLSVSRRHCSIEKIEENKYLLTDLQSKNGTFVNGVLIKDSSIEITTHDIVVIGKHMLSIGEPKQKITAIELDNIEKIFSNNKIGFHTLNVSIAVGEFVAIMGPSGCGKSTILKAVAGVSPANVGSVKLNGIDFYSNYKYLKYQIGYVPQDDILYNDLTVQQSLQYSYKLWSNNSISNEELNGKIQSVLQAVNLTDIAILDKKVHTLSGGQRKRIAIATELLFEPRLLLLDEPTSPLDPETENEFLLCLRQLTKQGITVLMVTHKPEDLHFVTKILFMGSAGYTCYYGKPDNFLHYFKKASIVEIYALLSYEFNAKEAYQQFVQSHKNTTIIKPNSEIEKGENKKYLHQFYWLTHRYATAKFAQKEFLVFSFLQAPIIAFLLVLIFKDITIGSLFIMVISSIWFGVSNAAREIADETFIYAKERMNGLCIAPYIGSKILVLSVLTFAQIIMFSAICFASTGNKQLAFNNILFLLSILLSSGFLALLLGLVLSAIVKSGEQAIAFMPMLLIPQVILAGIIHPIENKIVDFLSCFTISRWHTHAMAYVQEKVIVDNVLQKTKEVACALQILNMPNTFNTNKNLLLIDIIAISFWAFLMYATIYFFIKRKDVL